MRGHLIKQTNNYIFINAAYFEIIIARRSGFKSMAAIPTVEVCISIQSVGAYIKECARAMLANERLGLGSGMVFAVPVPTEHACDAAGTPFSSRINDRKTLRGRSSRPSWKRRLDFASY